MRHSILIALAAVFAGIACTATEDTGPSDKRAPTSTGKSSAAIDGLDVVQVEARVDIVSDLPGARVTDPTLINAWGLAFNPLGVARVSANGSGLSEVYSSAGAHVIPSVVIPACRATVSAPTGQTFNSVPNTFMGDAFIFVTEQGTVAGWQPSLGSQAALRFGGTACGVTDPVADVYKGVTIATNIDNVTRLYAANFRTGTVDVFDTSYARVQVSGNFADPTIPAGFAPFNVQEINRRLIVTYARQDAARQDDVPGLGNGYVNLFDTDGNLLGRLVSDGELNSPWGVAYTPDDYGRIPNRLLVGNFGDGLIHVYLSVIPLPADTTTPQFRHEGVIGNPDGTPMVIDGLWALRFGVDAGGFSSNTLYFTAGPANETHGVFGALSHAPFVVPF
jgi:uncharacterized protein (TIGR03118 family)